MDKDKDARSSTLSSSLSLTPSPSLPSPVPRPRALTPPPRRPASPITPAPSSPRVNTVPLPDLSPGPSPVPITVTGPSTPVAGIFGMMGLSLEPGAWTIGSPVPVSGLGIGPGASLPASGAGTPTRSHHHHGSAISPAGLIALHNSFERYERDAERRWVATSTTTSTAASPEGSPVRSMTTRAPLPPLIINDDPDTHANGFHLPEEAANHPQHGGAEPAPEHHHQPSADDAASPTTHAPLPPHSDHGENGPEANAPGSPPSSCSSVSSASRRGSTSFPSLAPPQQPLALSLNSRPTPEPLVLPSSTHMAFPLPTPRVLDLDEVRRRRHEGVLTHWPAVTRIAGHTVIHRAVPGKPEEYAFLDEGDSGAGLFRPAIDAAASSSTVDPSPFGTSPPASTPLALVRRSRSPSPASTRRPSLPLSRRSSRPSNPAIFGPDLAGPLVARIARSRAAGTPEAWWAWGAPAIRSAAWGVLEDEPPLESVTAANPHSHATTTVETVTSTTTTTETEEVKDGDEITTTTVTTTDTTTTTSAETTTCACADSPLSWGEGGGFTTRLGSFVFAPPFEEWEASEMRAAAAAAVAALTVCDGACGCEDEPVALLDDGDQADTAQEVEVSHLVEDQVTPTERTPTAGTTRAVGGSAECTADETSTTAAGTSRAGPLAKAESKETAGDDVDAAASGLLGLSLAFSRPAIRLSKSPFSLDKDNEREARDPAPGPPDSHAAGTAGTAGTAGSGPSRLPEPPTTPPNAPVPMPNANEPMSPRSRRLGSVFGLSPRKRK